MNSPSRRSFLASSASAVASSLLFPAIGHSQAAIPDRAIRLVVGFGRGNGIDRMARLMAPALEQRTGRRYSVDNRPGEAGTEAGEVLKNGPKDGSFLAFMPATTFAARLTMDDYPFDPLVDLVPVTLIGTASLAIAVSPKLGISTFQDYLAYVQGGAPERLLVGSTVESDTFEKVYGRMLDKTFGAAMKLQTYSTGTALLDDVDRGQIPAAISDLPTLLTAHRADRLRIVLLTGNRAAAAAPLLPTAAALGVKELELREWYGIFVSAQVPPATVDVWRNHLRNQVEEDGTNGELRQLGLDVRTSTPEEASAEIVKTLQEWRSRMATLGIPSVN